ncbi:MAG: hypothetical protein F2681_05890 [Actinobacteria bacterium]|uniref:Unannotated protein n=1 Tax=freshwater metagenome TaxID=449393 RepID=A0A6J6A3L3_9ZZZZ|nr:hypothetical protein [Actinomycetota bacterium]MSW77415.1 hypothetical protein [Actinomycetota bacterium]MSZ82654.1 hypothetical protein [Actinomycetota bacterium]MTB17556.1 hypothetical protein [Actinomycetota bacterium]
MSDELESILTESLQQRAQQVGVRTHGFGDVRRRVRRHRQRQMAAGLLPAVAGFGFIVTRQVAHDPLSPGGAAGCDTPQTTTSWLDGTPGSSTVAPPPWTGEPTTLPMDAPYVTDAKGRVYYLDANGNVVLDADGNPVPVSEPVGTTTTYFRQEATTTEVDGFGNPVPTTYTTDANGYPATTIAYDPQRDGTTTTVDPRVESTTGNVMETSTTIACEVPTTDPLATGPADTTPAAVGDSTTSSPTLTENQDYSFVVFVNASTVNDAGALYAAGLAGSKYTPLHAPVSMTVQTSYVMAAVGSESAAQSIARTLGIADVRTGIDTSVVSGKDLSGITVVVVIGENHASALTSPTTTAPQSITSSAG